MVKAEIIAIGSELLSPFRTDTNSLFLTQTLEDSGVRLVAKSIIGDELSDLVRAFEVAASRADVIICSGGLGPTIDDLTKEALAAYLKIPLLLHQEILESIEQRFSRRGMKMPEINRTQALIPEGATVLPNHFGSAPGVFLEAHKKQFFLLPGPPFELEPMWKQYGLPLLRKDQPSLRKIFRIAMMPESKVDEILRPVSAGLRNVRYTILASPAEIEVHLLASQTAEDELVSASAEIRAIMGDRIYTEENEKLEEVVGRLLKQNQKTIALAESCTGGFLGHRITEVPGSSAYLMRGLVVYSNQAKIELLNIPADLIETNGAVSEPVAKAMAENIRKMSVTDYGIAITGIAGPDGGSDEKPVGTVFIAIADEKEVTVKKYVFPGIRRYVKYSSTQAALDLLRLKIVSDAL